MISQLGEIFKVITDKYFEESKNKMRSCMGIPKSILDKYFDDICFMVDIDFFLCLDCTTSRVLWLIAISYEVNINEVTTTLTALLSEDIDWNFGPFDTYDTIKDQMNPKTSEPKKDKKRIKEIKGLEGKDDEEEESKDTTKAKESKGKELAIVKPKATKKKKIIIVDPKVKEDLKRGMRKHVTHKEPKRRILIQDQR